MNRNILINKNEALDLVHVESLLCGTRPTLAMCKLFCITCRDCSNVCDKLCRDPVDICAFVSLTFQQYYLTTLVRTDLRLDSLDIKYYNLSNGCLFSKVS
jgi:hypothetical protein